MRKPRLILLLSALTIACGDSPMAPDTSRVAPTLAEESGGEESVTGPASGPAVEVPSVVASVSSDAGIVTATAFDLSAWLAGALTFESPLPSTLLAGAFDPGLLTYLMLDICAPADCGVTSIAAYTASTGSGSELLRLDSGEEYFVVNWHTGDFGLAAGTYRLRVLAAGLEVGMADVVIVDKGSGLKDAKTGSSIALLDGRTLPVKFAVARNPLIAAWVAAIDGATASEVLTLLAGEFGLDGVGVAEALAIIGFGAGEVAGAFAAEGLEAAAIIELLTGAGLVTTAAETVAALLSAGYDVLEIAGVLRDVFQLTASEAAAALGEGGVVAADAADAIGPAFGIDLAATVRALGDGGFGAADVGDWALGASGGQTVEAVTSLLAASGFDIGDVGTWSVDNLLDLALTLQILDPNYGESEAAEWLYGHLQGAADEFAQVLEQAGSPVDRVINFLGNVKSQSFDTIAGAVAFAGYKAEIAAEGFRRLLGASLDTVAGKLEGLWGLGAGAIANVAGKAGYVAGEVADWTLGAAGGVVDAAMQIMIDGGFTAAEAVGGFVLGTQATLSDIALGAEQIFAATLHEWVPAMSDALAITDAASDVARKLHATYAAVIANLGGPTGLAGITQTVGDLSSFGFDLEGVGDWTADNVLELFLAVQILDPNYGSGETAEWLFDYLGGVADETASVLQQAGYTAGQIAEWALGAAGDAVDAAMQIMMDAGFTAAEAVQGFVQGTQAALSDIALGAEQIFAATLHEWVPAMSDALAITDAASDVARKLHATYAAVIANLGGPTGVAGITQTVGDLSSFGFELEGVGDWTADNVLELFLVVQILDPNYGPTETADWLWDHLGGDGAETTAVLAEAGRTAGEVVEFLVDQKNQVIDAVASMLATSGYTADVSAAALLTDGGASPTQVASALYTYWNQSALEIAQILKDLSVALTDIIVALLDGVNLLLTDVIDALLQVGYTGTQITAALP